MAAPAIEELRRLRNSGIDDPERVVHVGGNVLDKGGFRAAGDECTTPTTLLTLKREPDWTIMDQIAVAALITENDALAKVFLTANITFLPLELHRPTFSSVSQVTANLCTYGNAT